MALVGKPLMELALQKKKGNQLASSIMLGINRNTFRKRAKLYNVELRGYNN